MIITKEVAKQLINLNPSGFVDQKIANRQFEVIVKSFNSLFNGNSFVYIADEVGLGKTYIALGIISLLRHFSDDPFHYQDMIIVPKRNLQDKWQKEISRFVENNYLYLDNRVKSTTGKPIGKTGTEEVHNKLSLIQKNYPSYHIFRFSSFSLAVHQEGKKQWEALFKQFIGTEYYSIIEKLRIDYRKNNDDFLRSLYAYMLNVTMPCVDSIVVDEIHNFKHGIGGEVSQRNKVMSRIMGVIQNEDDDKKIFSDFPELREKIKPLAKKTIFLSATPINTSMIEMKNQFDVFLPNHKYKNLNSETCCNEIAGDLSRFLIRGVMNIDVNQKPYSRNMYRHEHRKGNVEMKYPNPAPISLDTAKSVILTGLMQYKIMKELDLKNNRSFEIGLLSGFESFSVSPKDIIQDFENENSQNVETVDQTLINDIANDYQQNFKETIPHPKMDVLVDELFNDLQRGNKSLVFVRRIASVKELEHKISLKYSNYLINSIKSKSSSLKNNKIKLILEEYETMKDNEKVDSILRMISAKIIRNKGIKDLKAKKKIQINSMFFEVILNYLIELRERSGSFDDEPQWSKFESELTKYRDLIRKNINKLKRLDRELLDISIYLILNAYMLIDQENAEIENDEVYEEDAKQSAKSISSFFFTSFMRTSGKPFKKVSYKKTWFELNFLHIVVFSKTFSVDIDRLERVLMIKENDSDAKIFRDHQAIVKESIYFRQNAEIELSKIHEQYKTKTFLTDLLTIQCENEFDSFLKRILREKDVSKFLISLETLEEILKGVFRNGSGTLPAYLAWALERTDYSSSLLKILQSDYNQAFSLVLMEIKAILNDFEKIVAVNFPETGKVHTSLLNQIPVQGVSGYHKVNVSKAALQFRMPGWPLVLIATDILKEGEDLHTYCSKVYHYGIAWNPSDMEQRTGRIDRIGSKCYHQIHNLKCEEIPFEKKLQVFFPYIQDSIEVIQVAKVFYGMNKFIETFYDFTNSISAEKKAEITENIISIPEQITSKIESKYDVNNFIGFSGEYEKLTIRPVIGFNHEELKMKLVNLKNKIQERHVDKKDKEWVDIVEKNLRINGMIFFEDENFMETNSQRHCPFSIQILNGNQPGTFIWHFQSPIGVAVNISDRLLNSFKSEFDINFYNSNETLIAFKEIPIETDTFDAINIFDQLVFNADKVEQRIFGNDWTEYDEFFK